MKKRNRKVGMLLGMSALIAIHSAMITVPAQETELAAETELTEETGAAADTETEAETEAARIRDEIFAGSSVSYLDETDTEGLDAQVLAYARYEIMARKGILFDSEELNSYFTAQNWYFGFIPESTADDSMFTDCELANMKLLQAAEKAASENGAGYVLDQPGWTSEAVLSFRGLAAEAPAEALTETAAEEVTEAETEAVTEEVTEAETEVATEEVTETETEAVTEEVTETETVTEAVTEEVTETETVTEAVTEQETETETVTEAVTEEVTETEALTEAVTKMVTETAAAPLVPRQVTVPAGALSEGTVEEGDIANIDFCASADGMAVRGVSAENFNVMIGSGTLGTELEQELLGAEIGEVVTISVSYPGNYRSEVLAGKDVVYEVVVNYIYRLSQMTPEPETGTETETQVTDTETETQVAETEIETETQVAETEIETQVAETETETETQVTETETEAQAAGDIYGMLAETVSEEESAKFRMPSGAYLISVDPQSAAGLAGLLAGDVITGIDRAAVNSAEFMNMLLSSYAEGEEAVIRYQRLDGGSYKEYIAKMTLLKEVDDTILQGQTETQDTEKLQSENGQHAEGPGTSQGSTQQHAEGPGTSQAGTQQHAEGPGTSQTDAQQHTTEQQDDTQQHTVNPQISQVIVGNTGSAQWQQSGPTVLDEYIFPDVDSRYLTDSEISLLTLQQVCYAKNEVYAIHGRQFVSVELQQYFGSKSWYYGFIAPSDFSDSVFNDIEKANIQKLVNRENALSGGAGYKLDQPGYDISLAGTASLK